MPSHVKKKRKSKMSAELDILGRLQTFQKEMDEFKGKPLHKKRIQMKALLFLFRRADNGALFCSNNKDFERQLELLLGKPVPRSLRQFFSARLASPASKTGAAGSYTIAQKVSYNRLLENAWFVRNLLQLRDGDADILIACSTEPMPLDMTGAIPVSVADGEAQAIGPLALALAVAYPERQMRFLIGGSSIQERTTWRSLVRKSHIVTLGASDSNPTRREILAHELRAAYESVHHPIPNWLQCFELNRSNSEKIVRFFAAHGPRLGNRDWSQRHIVLKAGKYKNYLFDTQNPSGTKDARQRTLMLSDKNGKPISITGKRMAARHRDYSLVNVRLRNPWNKALTCHCFAGCGTFGTGAGALTMTMPSATEAFSLRALDEETPLSLALQSKGGGLDLFPLEVQILG